MAVLSMLVAIFLGLLFLVSGVAKLLDRRAFLASVAAYKLLPTPLVPSVAYLIIMLELLVSVMLIFNVFSNSALLTASILLMVFSLAITVNLLRGRSDIDCGCLGGLAQQHLGWSIVIRNSCLAALGTAVLIGQSTLTGSIPHALSVDEAIQMIPLAIAAFLLYLMTLQVWVLRPIPPPYQTHPNDL
jgi:hypothetical protein